MEVGAQLLRVPGTPQGNAWQRQERVTHTTCFTLTRALLGYHLKLLTLAPGKAWSGKSKGDSVLNGKGRDPLASQSCCVHLDHSFYLSHQWTSCAESTQCHSSAATFQPLA